jgi:hypothetical protein
MFGEIDNMKITKMIKTISRTINLGSFNSIKIENGVEAEIELGDTIGNVEEDLYSEVRRAMANDLRRIKEERQKSKESE